MRKGEIFKGTKRGRDAARHPIVYLGGNADGSFVGAVLTHSEKLDNSTMKKEHFKESDVDGKKYELDFDNTLLVGKCFIKPQEWGPYIKIGELTKEGIEFVESVTRGQSPVFWDDYVDRQ